MRTDPEKRFVSDPASLDTFTGTSVNSTQRALIFYVLENSLFLSVTWCGRGLPALALDERRFVYENLGLVTFQFSPDNPLSAVEWWNQVFRPTEGKTKSCA